MKDGLKDSRRLGHAHREPGKLVVGTVCLEYVASNRMMGNLIEGGGKINPHSSILVAPLVIRECPIERRQSHGEFGCKRGKVGEIDEEPLFVAF